MQPRRSQASQSPALDICSNILASTYTKTDYDTNGGQPKKSISTEALGVVKSAFFVWLFRHV